MDRRRRLLQMRARRIVFHGERLAGHMSDDIVDTSYHPKTMSKSEMFSLFDYLKVGPYRWHIEMSAYCVDHGGNRFIEQVEIDTSQTMTYSEAITLYANFMDELHAGLNPNHIFAYGVRMNIL